MPGWVPAIPQLEQALKILASDSVVISDKLLVERYGEALFAATGFTKRAETINGRLAVRLPLRPPRSTRYRQRGPQPRALTRRLPALCAADDWLCCCAGRDVQG